MFYPAHLLSFIRPYTDLNDYVRQNGGDVISLAQFAPNGVPYFRVVYTTPGRSQVETTGLTDPEAQFRLLLALQLMEAEAGWEEVQRAVTPQA